MLLAASCLSTAKNVAPSRPPPLKILQRIQGSHRDVRCSSGLWITTPHRGALPLTALIGASSMTRFWVRPHTPLYAAVTGRSHSEYADLSYRRAVLSSTRLPTLQQEVFMSRSRGLGIALACALAIAPS